MNEETKTIKHIVYCRKSSESEERQALSLESQTKELDRIKSNNKLKTTETLSESKSAKKPGRLAFNTMLEKIKNGEANAILAWSADRLSRNSVDTGALIYLMDQKFLLQITTASRVYKDNPYDKFLFNLDCSQAKLENDNKGISSQRGMRTKAEKGWYPAPAPTGYKNNPLGKKGYKTIRPDKKRFDLIRKSLLKVLDGEQVIDIWKTATDVWKLTNKAGLPIPRSTFYNLLTNPFYSGDYEWPKGSGKWYHGRHQAMVTPEQFDQIQKMLGRKGRPVRRSHRLDLNGLYLCETCGCSITGTVKTKYYRGTNRTVTYTYHHCTRKNHKIECHEDPITEIDLKAETAQELEKIKPPQDFIDWANRWIDYLEQSKADEATDIKKSQKSALDKAQTSLDRLLDVYLNNSIDETTYESKKRELNKKIEQLKALLLSDNSQNEYKAIRTTIDYANRARDRFMNGEVEDKRYILNKVGSNLYLHNKKVRIDLKERYKVFANQEKWSELKEDWIESQEYRDIQLNNPLLIPSNPAWLPLVNAFKNREIKFGFSLQNIQTVFETFKIQPICA
ncbi:MAG TPA: recombinase family protein [Candidatus Woesebacteria bacterium]|nr:recombinase family protein [Candidatus Woesebacteria bacterium]